MCLQLYAYRPITPDDKSFVSFEPESMQKDVVVDCFKEVLWNFKGGAEKNTKDLRIFSALAQMQTPEPQEHEVRK